MVSVARCLRCRAGNEWIEGKVPDEAASVRAAELVAYILDGQTKRLDRDVLRSLAKRVRDETAEEESAK